MFHLDSFSRFAWCKCNWSRGFNSYTCWLHAMMLFVSVQIFSNFLVALFDVRSTVWLFLCVVVKRTLWRFAFGPNDGGTLENFYKFLTVCKFIRRVDIVQLLASFPSSFWILGLFVDKQNIFLSLAFWTVFSLFFVSVCQSFNLFKVLRLRNRDWVNSLL